MNVVYALQPLGKSIFLAGPTPRSPETPSWRPEAIQILQELGFDGTVLVPESADWKPHSSYDQQIHWEWEGLNQATVIAFWIPRELEHMPAFTTNVEYGLEARSGKLVLGHPQGAPKMSYLSMLADRYGITVRATLRSTLSEAVSMTRRPFGLRARQGG